MDRNFPRHKPNTCFPHIQPFSCISDCNSCISFGPLPNPSIMIHEKIRHFRELRRLRDEDMAERLNISQSTYSRLEKGEIKMDVERLGKIAEILEVPVEELLSPDSVVFHIGHNSGGSNGWYNHQLVQQFPQEIMQPLLDRFEAHIKELHEMNRRLLTLLERGQG